MRDELLKEEFKGRLRGKISGLREVHLAVCRRMNSSFAFYVQNVSESAVPPPIRMLPRAPEFITGIVSHRGKVIPVLEIKEFAPVPEVGMEKVRMVIVADTLFVSGILINGYPFFITVSEDEIQSADAIFPRYVQFLKGVVRRDGDVIPIINVSEIFKVVRTRIERR